MVATRLVKELAEFNGELSLEGLHFWRTVFSAMTHPAATITSSSQVLRAGNSEATKEQTSPGDKKIILLPCRNPPRREHVQLWLEARKQYESLHNVRQEKKAGLNVEVNPEGYECKSVACEKFLNVRRQKRQSMSLVVSPMRNTVLTCKSTEVSPISDGASLDMKKHKEEDDNDDLAVLPESPELPSWLQQTMISENHPVSPSLSPFKKTKKNSSPLCISNKEECEASPVLNSTPILKRRRRSREELEPLCSTPISEGKELVGVEFLFFHLSCLFIELDLFFSPCDLDLRQKTPLLRDCNNREETRPIH